MNFKLAFAFLSLYPEHMSYYLTAMWEPSFIARLTEVCGSCNTMQCFSQLIAIKMEQTLNFRNMVRPVAACDMSTATRNALLS